MRDKAILENGGTLTLFNRMGSWGGEGKKVPISFSPVTSTNVGISPQNFSTFSFNLLLQL